MKVEREANEVLQQCGRTRGQRLSVISVGRSGGMRASAPADEGRWGFAGQLVGRWRFRMIGGVVLAVTKQ